MISFLMISISCVKPIEKSLVIKPDKLIIFENENMVDGTLNTTFKKLKEKKYLKEENNDHGIESK